MTDNVLVDRTRTRLLPPNAPEKGFQITREEAAKLGLVESSEKPVQERRSALPGPLRNVEKVGPTAKPPQRRRSAARKPRK